MRPRHLLVALLAPALFALPAEAAPKKHPCSPLITDPRGDATGILTDGEVDIVSASLLLTKDALTATLTLAAPPPSGFDPRMPAYHLSFSTGKQMFGFRFQPWSVTNGTWGSYVSVRGTSVVWRIPRWETGLPAGPLYVHDAYASTYVAGHLLAGGYVDDARRPRAAKPVRCGS